MKYYDINEDEMIDATLTDFKFGLYLWRFHLDLAVHRHKSIYKVYEFERGPYTYRKTLNDFKWFSFEFKSAWKRNMLEFKTHVSSVWSMLQFGRMKLYFSMRYVRPTAFSKHVVDMDARQKEIDAISPHVIVIPEEHCHASHDPLE